MLKLYPVPGGEPVSRDYSVIVNGLPAELYTARVSAMPFNRVWPGSQRPIVQTELSSFVCFSSDEAVELTVTASADFSDLAIRPLSRGVKAEVSGRTAVFTLEKPGQYTFEPDGFHRALHIFFNPVFDFGVNPDDPGVRYFGPGVHEPRYIELHSGETLYIDGGAVVRTSVYAKDTVNVRIVGEGVLDNSWEKRDSKECAASPNGCVKFRRCANVEVKGVILRDSSVWTATMFNCDNVVFDNVKAIGMWRYNSDGFDFVNSSNGLVKDCFLRCFDDCVVLKGLKGWDTRNVENIRVTGCVIWCDWGRALEIGAETCADEYRNIIFEDCDIIHGGHISMDIQNGDRAFVHDVLFQNIRAEYSRYTLKPIYQDSSERVYDGGEGFVPALFTAHSYTGMWSKDNILGQIGNITFRDISVQLDEGLEIPASTFIGAGAEHMTKDIRLENITVNGRRVGKEELRIRTNEFTGDVTLV